MCSWCSLEWPTFSKQVTAGGAKCVVVAYIPPEHLGRPVDHDDDRAAALYGLVAGRSAASSIRDEVDQDHHQPRHLADSGRLRSGLYRIDWWKN